MNTLLGGIGLGIIIAGCIGYILLNPSHPNPIPHNPLPTDISIGENEALQQAIENDDCGDECSNEYERGYQWAENHDTSTTQQCPTPSSKFHEGCIVYIEETYGYE